MSDSKSLPEPASAAIGAGLDVGSNPVRDVREARGYSVEDLAVTCGLSVDEITAIENGEDADPDRLRRIASSLGLPETVLIGG